MKTLEEVLQNALTMLERYPNNLECLAVELHNITEACASEADDYGLAYSKEDARVSEIV